MRTPSIVAHGEVVPGAGNLLSPQQVMMPDFIGAGEPFNSFLGIGPDEERIAHRFSRHLVARLSPEIILLVLSFCAPDDTLQVGT